MAAWTSLRSLGKFRVSAPRDTGSVGEVPVVAVHTFVVRLTGWRVIICFKDIRYDDVQPVIVDAHMPSFFTNRVVNATLPSVTLALESITRH